MAFDDQTAQLPTQYQSWWHRKGWPGRPSNHFTNRIGVTPGTGEIILLRSQLDKIAINEARTLLVYDGDNNQREFPNIHIVRADCITPSIPGHPDAAYRVVVADRRRMWSLIPCDRGYNVRATAGGSYEATTTDSGTPWTWSGMLGDIWDLLNEGSLPALPTTPQGTPDGFAFYGQSCAQALGNVLDRLGWSLAWLPGDDTWQFVELGAADSSFDSLATEMMQYRIDDDEPIDPGIGRYPGNVRVVFTNQPVVTGGKSPYTTIDVVAPAPNQDGEDASLTAIIHDDLPAIYSGATNTNASDLTARANARAAEYFRDLREGGQHYRRIYSGVREFDLGSKVGSVRHETGERGTVTVVERSPVGREWSGTDRMWRMVGGAGGGGSVPDAAYDVSGKIGSNSAGSADPQWLGSGVKYFQASIGLGDAYKQAQLPTVVDIPDILITAIYNPAVAAQAKVYIGGIGTGFALAPVFNTTTNDWEWPSGQIGGIVSVGGVRDHGTYDDATESTFSLDADGLKLIQNAPASPTRKTISVTNQTLDDNTSIVVENSNLLISNAGASGKNIAVSANDTASLSSLVRAFINSVLVDIIANNLQIDTPNLKVRNVFGGPWSTGLTGTGYSTVDVVNGFVVGGSTGGGSGITTGKSFGRIIGGF